MAEELDGVTLHDLYETYPDFHINVAAEQARVEAHDVIVLQHPMHWYNCPALTKEWLDRVLTHGWAYGAGAAALRDKGLLCAISTGGQEGAFRQEGASRHTVDQFLAPFDQTANLCGMRWLRPHVFHGSHAAADAEIAANADAWRARLIELRDTDGGGPN